MSAIPANGARLASGLPRLTSQHVRRQRVQSSTPAAAKPGVHLGRIPANIELRKSAVAVHAAFKSESGEEIPQAIIDAEERSASGRQFRYVAYGVFGGLAGLLTVTRVGLNVIGMSPATEFLQPSALGEMLDIIVIGTAGLMWSQEQSTQEANIQRIWEEVKRRKEAGSDPKLVTMDDLRKKKKNAKKNRSSRGFQKSATEAALKDEKKPVQTEAAGRQDAEPAAGSGLFSGIKSAIDNANNTGRIQALQMNDSLEQAGLLPPTTKKSSTASNGKETEDRD